MYAPPDRTRQPSSVHLLGFVPRTEKEIEDEKTLRYGKVKDNYLDLFEDKASQYRRACLNSYKIGGQEQQERIDRMKASVAHHRSEIAKLEYEIEKAEDWLHGDYSRKYGGEELVAKGYKEAKILQEFEEYFNLGRNDYPDYETSDQEDGDDAAGAGMDKPVAAAIFGERSVRRATTAAVELGEQGEGKGDKNAEPDRERIESPGLFVGENEEV